MYGDQRQINLMRNELDEDMDNMVPYNLNEHSFPRESKQGHIRQKTVRYYGKKSYLKKDKIRESRDHPTAKNIKKERRVDDRAYEISIDEEVPLQQITDSKIDPKTKPAKFRTSTIPTDNSFPIPRTPSDIDTTSPSSTSTSTTSASMTTDDTPETTATETSSYLSSSYLTTTNDDLLENSDIVTDRSFYKTTKSLLDDIMTTTTTHDYYDTEGKIYFF